MLLSDRISVLNDTIDKILSTTSLVEKRYYINELGKDFQDDFNCILEVLAGRHKLGYKVQYSVVLPTAIVFTNESVRDVVNYLMEPVRNHNLSEINIMMHLSPLQPYMWFFEDIMNRELKLGIGKSVLPQSDLEPMLAKKFDGSLPASMGYYMTEKLDGNRCIAWHDGVKWNFTSRNGSEMHVNFDMSGLDESLVYDGEVLSPLDVERSDEIYHVIRDGKPFCGAFVDDFNQTSGLINSHKANKDLIYNVFDVINTDMNYVNRRARYLNVATKNISLANNRDVRILPVLGYDTTPNASAELALDLLETITKIGGEGVMINLADSKYEHKRTKSILKLKKAYNMDMRVKEVIAGSGKYTGLVGSLRCVAVDSQGNTTKCFVGSGLTDDQRVKWARNPEKILGKIVEVEYFSKSQSKTTYGTYNYSLRFPRLKSIRDDKDCTSVD